MDRVEFADAEGRSPFGRWFDRLDPAASARLTVQLLRLRHGNMSAAKPIGSGIHELRIDIGPGYRVYFGNDGPLLVILLGGGSKQRQQADIEAAEDRWAECKRRKA